jgi:hypothetical protein
MAYCVHRATLPALTEARIIIDPAGGVAESIHRGEEPPAAPIWKAFAVLDGDLRRLTGRYELRPNRPQGARRSGS